MTLDTKLLDERRTKVEKALVTGGFLTGAIASLPFSVGVSNVDDVLINTISFLAVAGIYYKGMSGIDKRIEDMEKKLNFDPNQYLHTNQVPKYLWLSQIAGTISCTGLIVSGYNYLF
jgi:hypothetical protein